MRGVAVVLRHITHVGGARATIGTGLVLVALGERRVGLAALFANALSHLAVQVLKRTVRRTRPCDAAGRALALVDLPDPFSFPSGHAAAVTAVAASVGVAYPAFAPLLLLLSAWVAASRVSLRVHHVSDVLAGRASALPAPSPPPGSSEHRHGFVTEADRERRRSVTERGDDCACPHRARDPCAL